MATRSLTRIFIWIIYISLCWSTELDANITDDPQNISETTETIEIETTTSQLEMSTISSDFSKKNAGTQIENFELPIDCSQREKLKIQPLNDRNSRLKKCCPHGESLSVFGESQSDQMCDTTHLAFEPSKINVVLYDNCIEDMETEVSLPLEIGNPCNTSFLYTSEEDQFYVLQDGSLLIIDEFGNDTYTVEKKYCLDIDNISGITYAIICITSVEEHLNRSQIMTVAILMLVSVVNPEKLV